MSPHFLDEPTRSFQTHADRTALVYRGADVSYAELDHWSRHAAGWMQQER